MAASRVSSSPAKRMWLASAASSTSTSWPKRFQAGTPRRNAALSRTALDGEKM
jgi:hypothetical protein